MKTITHVSKSVQVALITTALISGVAVMSLPLFAQAANYAYVDASGEVRSVTADTWMMAIATAQNIHMHSGVLLLDSASDYDVVGNDVRGY